MSENTSPHSPTSSRGWTEDYDGAEEIERTWRAGLTPDLPLTVSEWADRYRILSCRASSVGHRVDRSGDVVELPAHDDLRPLSEVT